MPATLWDERYPPGVAHVIDPDIHADVPEVMREACRRFASHPAFSGLGRTLSYGELDALSAAFAVWLQEFTDLQPGDRIAIQLPNLLQYPVAVFGALRAGLILVNTNPLYTARELEHQLQDSGAVAIVCLANMAHTLESVLGRTRVRHVVITEVGDLLPLPRRWLVNAVVRHIRHQVPHYRLPQAVKFNDALEHGRDRRPREHHAQPDDIAVLQYTGGTTGVAKGAMLTHRNLIANMLQCKALMGYTLKDGEEVVICPLPLYHIYAFTFHCMAMVLSGNHNVLIPNPRDLPAMLAEMRNWRFSVFVGLNTLFIALCNSPAFRELDFSAMKITISGGMALQKPVADHWQRITGCEVCEGYGLTEASPVVTVNPPGYVHMGSIGIPMPSTLCRVVDDEGNECPPGVRGELCVHGPQVMKGYWNRPQETAGVLDALGWLKTGDIAQFDADDYLRIVDRKKDMILVSGFNVYPCELEEVLMRLPGVVMGAAIGVPDPHSGEAIKLFVVADPAAGLNEKLVRQHMRASLTGYKVPHLIEFRDSLPLSNIGKILRRELREQELQRRAS